MTVYDHTQDERISELEFLQSVRFELEQELHHLGDDSVMSLGRAVAHGFHVGAGRESAQLLAGMGFGRTAIEHLVHEALRAWPLLNITLSTDRIMQKVEETRVEEE